MAKPARIPCPIEVICYHTKLQFMSGAGYRAVLCVALSYWLADCPNTTLDAMAYQALAHMNASQWTHVKDEVLPTLAAILPELAAIHHGKVKARQHMSAARRKAALAGVALRQHKPPATQPAQAVKVLTDSTQPATRYTTPACAPEFHNPMASRPPRELAALPGKPQSALARLRDD